MLETLTVVAPALALEAAFWRMIEDYDGAGEHALGADSLALARRDFAAFIARFDAEARGEPLRPGIVPQNTFWLVRDGAEILGRSALRHRLSPALEDVGGHIGYDIRPSFRRRGYATRLLALTLERASALGLARVLLTCDTDNVASARVIEKNGGVLASQGISPALGKHVSRYWIAL